MSAMRSTIPLRAECSADDSSASGVGDSVDGERRRAIPPPPPVLPCRRGVGATHRALRIGLRLSQMEILFVICRKCVQRMGARCVCLPA